MNCTKKIIVLTLSLLLLVTGGVLAQNQMKSAKSLGIEEFKQAPMLDELVEKGELPPVVERLPEDPIVVKPVEKIGEYGGTWNRIHNNDGMGPWYQTNYNEPFVRWTRDADDILFNLVRNWEWNEDKTEIVLHFVEGVKWSDGALLTVDDFLFWWEDMVLDDRLPQTPPKGTHIAGDPMQVEKIDDYTLKFIFPGTNPIFLQHMTLGPWSSANWVVPAHYLKQFHPGYNSELEDDEVNELIDRFSNRHQYPDMPTFTAWRTVEFETGERAVFERNPYYWKVDSEGNQLPYIDKVVSRRIQDAEMQTLKTIEGEIDCQFRGFNLKDIFLLSENQEKGNYKVVKWERGEFAWPWLMIAYNNPDKAIRDLLYNKKFRRALSYSIDRNQINNLVFMGLGQPIQMALLPEVPVFQTSEGKKLIDEWQNSFVEYKPAEAEELLNEVGMVDVDGDGFRERPDGEKFNLIVDVSTADTFSVDALELIKQTWEEIGIKTTINPLSGTAVSSRRLNEEYMISAWGSAAAWWPLMDPFIWTSVAHFPQTIAQQSGLYYESGGERGKAPREGSMLEKLQDYYTQASTTADNEERNQLLLKAFKLHIDEGPITIGTVGYTPSLIVYKNYFHNVPDFGYIGHWYIGYPGTANPEQFYISK